MQCYSLVTPLQSLLKYKIIGSLKSRKKCLKMLNPLIVVTRFIMTSTMKLYKAVEIKITLLLCKCFLEMCAIIYISTIPWFVSDYNVYQPGDGMKMQTLHQISAILNFCATKGQTSIISRSN